MERYQTIGPLHSKGNQQNGKADYGMGEMVANHISDKGLLFKLFRKHTLAQ